MTASNRSVKITIDAQATAKHLAKQFNISHTQVLKTLSEKAGFEDFGACRANSERKTKSSSDIYAIMHFVCVHSGRETDHSAVFHTERGTLADLENQAIDYVLGFYDDDSDEDYEKKKAALKSDGSFWCCNMENLTRKLKFREITKHEYDCYLVAQSL